MHREYDLERLLMEVYIKVLRINLTEDTYEEIKVIDAERDAVHGYASTISGWLTQFANSGGVHEEDRARYGIFTQIEALRYEFAVGHDNISVLYRRRNEEGAYRWARMTLRKSYDYTPDREMVMLYIEDVHDEIAAQREIAEQRWITQALVRALDICLYVDLDDYSYRRMHVAPAFKEWVPQSGHMADMISTNVTKAIVPYDPVSLQENFSPRVFCEQLMTQLSYDYGYRARTAQGDAWYRVAAILVDRHIDRTPHHVIIAMQNITRQVELGAQEAIS